MKQSVTKNLLLASALTTGILCVSTSQAESYYQRSLNNHEEPVKTLVRTWANNGSNQEMSQASLDIVAVEMSYSIENKTLDSDNFVLHLANDKENSNGFEMKSEYDFPVFAYRVFKHKVTTLTGFQPDIKALFYNQQFEIYAR